MAMAAQTFQRKPMKKLQEVHGFTKPGTPKGIVPQVINVEEVVPGLLQVILQILSMPRVYCIMEAQEMRLEGSRRRQHCVGLAIHTVKASFVRYMISMGVV